MTNAVGQSGHLDRGIGLWSALSTNVLNMVGIGPFLTIPLALAAMGGPQAMLGWILGALLALCDGMVWAELGSRIPDSGGSYHYLLQAFGPKSFGRLMAFLFLWQSLLIGPISIASGAVGFAEYAGVFHAMTPMQLKLVAMALCLINLAVLYRSIRSIGFLSIVVTVVVLATCCWIILSGLTHFQPSMAFDFPAGAFHLSHQFFLGLGSATLIAAYDYGGYNNVCLLGGEVKTPQRNIPRTVLLSIFVVATIYLAMNISILGVLPWREAQHSKVVVADFINAVHGARAAKAASVLILIASWGSAFAILLGFSRIPYAAAENGHFPKIFAKVHPREHFPTVSLIYMGIGSMAMCVFSLGALIAGLIVIQTMIQFLAQCVAVMLLRRQDHADKTIFRMPFYPLPAMIALLGWLYIVATSPFQPIAIGAVLILAGTAFYLFQANLAQEWPFHQT